MFEPVAAPRPYPHYDPQEFSQALTVLSDLQLAALEKLLEGLQANRVLVLELLPLVEQIKAMRPSSLRKLLRPAAPLADLAVNEDGKDRLSPDHYEATLRTFDFDNGSGRDQQRPKRRKGDRDERTSNHRQFVARKKAR